MLKKIAVAETAPKETVLMVTQCGISFVIITERGPS